MTIPLDRRSGRPVFRQIVDYLRRAIESGRLAPGTKLDPIRLLAPALAVNRQTVADASRELEAPGLTESTVGRGTYVLTRASARPHANGSPAGDRPFVPLIAPAAAAAAARPHLDYTAAPDAVRMEGIPGCSALFPVDDFRKAINQVMGHEGRELLGYGDAQGPPRLRRILVDPPRAGRVEAPTQCTPLAAPAAAGPGPCARAGGCAARGGIGAASGRAPTPARPPCSRPPGFASPPCP